MDSKLLHEPLKKSSHQNQLHNKNNLEEQKNFIGDNCINKEHLSQNSPQIKDKEPAQPINVENTSETNNKISQKADREFKES